MYDDHYGLTGRPFQLTPDPSFWFDTATHRKAMAYLGYGLSQGEGFIVITGDPGAGKTTLVGHLMATIDPERLNVIRLVTTQVEPDDLLRLVAAGLGVDHAGLSKAQLLAAIERGLHAAARAGRRTLLIVDEAQSLPVSAIEELRMLSNFQAGGYALLQIFLLGQPEFRERLHGSDRLEQLRQRVIAMHHLEPMEAEEVGPYLSHRLQVAGSQGSPSFSARAIALMHRWSNGVPRRLNQLASRALLHGAIEGIDRFEGSDIERVTADLDGDGLGLPGGVSPAASEAVDRLDVEPLFDPVEYRLSEPVQQAQDADDLPADVAAAEAEADIVEYSADGASGDDHGEEWVAEDVIEPEPLPMTPTPPPMPPRPLHLSVVANDADAFGQAPSVPTQDVGDVGATVEADVEEEAVAAEPLPADDLLLAERVALLEARLEEQDAALRRVLTLLVDWVEGEDRRPDLGDARVRA